MPEHNMTDMLTLMKAMAPDAPLPTTFLVEDLHYPRNTICWKYALEAIINWLLLYFLIHDNRLLSML